MTTTIEITVPVILDLLARRNDAVEEAILRIYDRQTADEQEGHLTKHDNGQGFSAFDAGFLTSLAEQIRANHYGEPKGRRLSPKQMTAARKAMRKYAGQLVGIAHEKQERKGC
jgi:hypothetical protein